MSYAYDIKNEFALLIQLRALVDPITYEISAYIALELATAWKTTEKLHIPTFDEGVKWDKDLFCYFFEHKIETKHEMIYLHHVEAYR